MLSNNSDISDYNLFFTTIQLRTRKIIIQMVEDIACNCLMSERLEVTGGFDIYPEVDIRL